VTGFNSPPFAKVPATVSTFKVGGNGVSEVLLAPSAGTAALAMRNQVPASCTRYTAVTKGKTFVYTVSEQPVRNLGRAARAMNIKASGAESINVWSVVYRASDFVGAVTIVGPGASANVVTTLAAQAYAHAAKTLH
jgi:5-enolpyruvylshikimate-3-phosphate synthase